MVHDAADVLTRPQRLDSIGVKFDEPRLVSDAGLLLAATLADRLGIEQLMNQTVRLGNVAGAAAPGRKVMTMIHGMLIGADSIDDMDLLRAGSTGLILGHQVMAPSTLGTSLRAFTFGHARQLNQVLDRLIGRAWKNDGTGPGAVPHGEDHAGPRRNEHDGHLSRCRRAQSHLRVCRGRFQRRLHRDAQLAVGDHRPMIPRSPSAAGWRPLRSLEALRPSGLKSAPTLRRLLGAALVALVIMMGAGWLAGWRTHVVTTPSMGRTAPVGTLIVSRPTRPDRISTGDIIVFHPPGQGDVTFVHRVTRVRGSGSQVAINTRGDTNGSDDPWTLHAGNVIGRVALRLPAIGYAIEVLPAALAALLAIILVTLSLDPRRRAAARITLGSLTASALMYLYRPLVHVSIIAETIVHGRGVASVVPTGILPLRIRAVGGSHVDLVPGKVGTVHLGHIPADGHFVMRASPHLTGYWWLLLITWALPVLAGVKAPTGNVVPASSRDVVSAAQALS